MESFGCLLDKRRCRDLIVGEVIGLFPQIVASRLPRANAGHQPIRLLRSLGAGYLKKGETTAITSAPFQGLLQRLVGRRKQTVHTVPRIKLHPTGHPVHNDRGRQISQPGLINLNHIFFFFHFVLNNNQPESHGKRDNRPAKYRLSRSTPSFRIVSGRGRYRHQAANRPISRRRVLPARCAYGLPDSATSNSWLRSIPERRYCVRPISSSRVPAYRKAHETTFG